MRRRPPPAPASPGAAPFWALRYSEWAKRAAPERPGYLRVEHGIGGQLDGLHSDQLLDSPGHPDVLADAAGDEELAFHLHALDEPGHPLGHGRAIGGEHPVDAPAGPQQGGRLRLGEDGAHVADRGRLLVDLERARTDVLDGHREHVGDDLHAPAGAGCALVVHDEVEHFAALVAADHLAVLPAHVEDGAHARPRHEVGPAGMAGDLGDGAVRERYVDPPVAGAHRVAHSVKGQTQRLARSLEGPEGAVGTRRTGAGGEEGEELSVGENDGLGTHRADIDADCHRGGSPPIEVRSLPGLFAPSPELLRCSITPAVCRQDRPRRGAAGRPQPRPLPGSPRSVAAVPRHPRDDTGARRRRKGEASVKADASNPGPAGDAPGGRLVHSRRGSNQSAGKDTRRARRPDLVLLELGPGDLRLSHDRRQRALLEFVMVGDRDCDRPRAQTPLHHDMAAVTPDLDKTMALEKTCYLMAGEDPKPLHRPPRRHPPRSGSRAPGASVDTGSLPHTRTRGRARTLLSDSQRPPLTVSPWLATSSSGQRAT